MSSDDDVVSGVFAYGGMDRTYLFARGRKRAGDALVISLHGYTGSAKPTLGEAGPLLSKGFAVLAPQGYKNSWNGGACCGEAKQLQLNDVDFLQQLTRFILTEYFAASYNNNNNKSDVGVKVYVMGISNGAFMTSKLALSQNMGREWVSAIAMRSGYSYELDLYSRAPPPPSAGMAVLALHGGRDDVVNALGCCSSRSTPCCCGIASSECVAFQRTVDLWKTINKCPSSSNAKEVPNFGFSTARSPGMLCELLDDQCGVTVCLLPKQGHSLDFLNTPAGGAQVEADFFWHDYTARWNKRRITPEGAVDVVGGGFSFSPTVFRSALDRYGDDGTTNVTNDNVLWVAGTAAGAVVVVLAILLLLARSVKAV